MWIWRRERLIKKKEEFSLQRARLVTTAFINYYYLNKSNTSTVILLTENFLIKMKKNNMPSTSNVVDNIKKMEAARAERRQKFEEQKQAKMNRDAENKACGRNVDVDFDILIG